MVGQAPPYTIFEKPCKSCPAPATAYAETSKSAFAQAAADKSVSEKLKMVCTAHPTIIKKFSAFSACSAVFINH